MNKVYAVLIVIVILAAVLRLYKIDSVPPSLSWDEAAVGYNAFTIANWGQDEYGKPWPIYFKSFGEGKQPIHIYVTAFFVKLFGLSEVTTRIPVAAFGTLNVLIIFFLAKKLFNNNFIGVLASLFLALSPQNIFFSRFNHEANFALFFFMAGLFLFIKAVEGRKRFLPISFLCFILSIISYNTSKVLVPPFVILISLLYIKDILRNRTDVLITSALVGVFVLLIIFNKELLGVTRYQQTAQGDKEVEQTQIFKVTQNYFLGRISLIAKQYTWHFDPKYLFVSGDKNSRLSAQYSSEFYYIDALFLITGFIFLIVKRSKKGLILLSWAILAPLPSSLVSEAPHAGRASFMMGSWHIVSALGLYTILNVIRKPVRKALFMIVVLIIFTVSLLNYLLFYFNNFANQYAVDWQYGMKEAVIYTEENPQYPYVFVTNVRSQPYIFFLYYLKMPLPEYLNTVTYNHLENKSSNTVSNFGRYYFSGWNPTTDMPNNEALYILTPSEYDGLLRRSEYNVKKVIYYPNGAAAFYIVSKI